MRSQTIRIKNLPEYNGLDENVHVKPTAIIIGVLIMGSAFLFLNSKFTFVGIVMVLISLFAIFVMPDKAICTFRDDYVILYNEREETRCNMVYYDEVVSWQYEWYPTMDKLVFNLVDGSSYIQEVYSKASVKDYLDDHLPHKEVKKARIKRAKS